MPETQQKLTWGTRILWQRKQGHGINKRAKKGKYLGASQNTRKHWASPNSVQLVHVFLDGNKHPSLVSLHEITVISP